jgi:hypothetical protein
VIHTSGCHHGSKDIEGDSLSMSLLEPESPTQKRSLSLRNAVVLSQSCPRSTRR